MSIENTDGNSQADGYEASKIILDKIEAVMTSKTKDNTRYPGSLSEIYQIKTLLKELKNIECNDETIRQRTAHYDEIVKTAAQYNYTGSWIFVGAMVAAIIVSFFFAMGNYKSTSDIMKMEEAEAIYNNKIMNANHNVEKYGKYLRAKTKRIKKLKLRNTQGLEAANLKIQKEMEQLAQLKIQLKESEKLLSDAQKETPEMILNANNTKVLREKKMRLLFNIYLICLPLLYFYSARMPHYMQVRRYGLLKAKKYSVKIFQVFFAAIAMLAMSTPKVTTTTTWSDGTKTKKTDDMGGAAVVGMVIFLVVVLYFVIGYLVPIIILINFCSNYIPAMIEKRNLTKAVV